MNELLYYQLALTQLPHIGPVLAKQLIAYCGGVKAVFDASKTDLLNVPGIGSVTANKLLKFNDFNRVEQEIKFIENHAIQVLFMFDDNFPIRLKQAPDSPLLLFTKGNIAFNGRAIAVVGSRKPTEYGKGFVQRLIADLTRYDVTVYSGLAYGIDTIAHRACLLHDVPTVGVLGHGIDRIYPSSHCTVAKRMQENGGLVTEFWSNTLPDKENFPKRNRIVAGLVDVVIVVESDVKGGSMITAHLANSYQRDVMALPGNIDQPLSRGCNALIKGHVAHVIEGVQDLVELMNWDVETQVPLQTTLFNTLDPTQQKIVACLKKGSCGIEDLMRESGLRYSDLSLHLLDLEMKHCIVSLPGKQYRLP